MLREAFRQMTTGTPGAVHLCLPFDTQKAPVDADDIHANPDHRNFPAERLAPDLAAIEEAAAILSKARSAIAICGGGPLLSGAEAALGRVARALDMPVATTVSGQGAIAETDPLALGVVGSNGGIPATRADVDAADVVLYIGCRAGSVTTERWRSPAPGTATILHIDSDPDVPGTIYDTAVAIYADARLALEALADALESRDCAGQNGTARAAAAWAAKDAGFAPLAASRDTPIRPEAVIFTLMDVLDDDAIIVNDPGTPCPYFSAYYRWPKPGRHFITNRAHGALGYSIGAAMGAHIGRPDVKTVAVMGDGSFGFACGEFESMVRYHMPITCIVFSNAVFGWIKAGQNAGFDKRFYNVDFNRTDHAAVASAFGVKSWTVHDPEDLRTVLAKAIAHDGPTLVDIHSQPLHEAAAPVSEWVA
jgi:acetolactate synthase-1/2/3 large subunit